MALIRFPNGHITRKCYSIQTPKNPRKRYCFLEKTQIQLIQLFISTMFRYKHQQKRLGIILDEKLNFKCHVDKVVIKTSKGISVIKRLRKFLLRK